MTTEPGYTNQAECERLDNILNALHGVNYALRHPKEMAAKEDKRRWQESHVEMPTPLGWTAEAVSTLISENIELKRQLEVANENCKKHEKDYNDLKTAIINTVERIANYRTFSS